MERNYPKIQITDKAARSLRSGHPWVYADEVLQADAACVDGQIVDVTTRSGHWLGAGFYNSASKIRVRVLSRNANDRFDEAFWARRIRYAVDYRRTVIGQDFDNCRLIFGEADGFPGLTVDRFGQILVAQVLSLGMELRKQQLFALLLQTLHADGAQIDAIYERNDVKLRQKEGMGGSLLKFRREFDQYVNLRPVRLFPGVPCPLAGKQPGDIDFYVVRENTEGEYSSLGGRVNEGTEHEVVIQESVFTRRGVDRILRYAFELAQSRPRKTLTSATKSNGLAISMPYWDERVEAMAENYPEIRWDKQHIDILCARFVMQTERFDVVVASNLFGDILSDLGPACTGTIGIAPSANLNPERTFPSLFEPVHGSAPDIYGKNIANPIATIWAGAMMLDFLGNGDERFQQAHNGILAAIEEVIAHGPKTPDMKGNATTPQVADAICKIILR